MEDYETGAEQLMELLKESDGRDEVVIYIENPKAMKRLPANFGVNAGEALVAELGRRYGGGNVKVV